MNSIRVVIDECVSPKSALVARFCEAFPLNAPAEMVLLAEQHRGIPDTEILHRILDRNTILLTSDRVLHNQACDLGLRSYTLDPSGNLTGRKLKQVCVQPRVAPRVDQELRRDYAHEANPIASILKAGLSERDFKLYRTRRRRIRSCFGSESHISVVSVTIGAMTTRMGMLCGFYLALAGFSAVKGIRASEGYARPASPVEVAAADRDGPTYCLLHALSELFLLQLELIPTELFIIPSASLELARAILAGGICGPASPYQAAAARLLHGLSSVKVFPCAKGRFFDSMESKLRQLGQGGSNELVAVDFDQHVHSLDPCHFPVRKQSSHE